MTRQYLTGSGLITADSGRVPTTAELRTLQNSLEAMLSAEQIRQWAELAVLGALVEARVERFQRRARRSGRPVAGTATAGARGAVTLPSGQSWPAQPPIHYA